MSTLAPSPRHTQLFALLHQQNMSDMAVARTKAPRRQVAKPKCAVRSAAPTDERSEEAILAALCDAAVRSFDRPPVATPDPSEA